MAQAFVLRSRMELGAYFSSQAGALFAGESDPQGQAEALSLQSYCASALGRSDVAIASATRGIALRAERQADASTGIGLNYFGVAAFWANDFGTASGALDASAWYGQQQGDAPLAYQALVNAAFTEVLRITQGEGAAHAPQDLTALARIVAAAHRLRSDGGGGFVRGGSVIGYLLLDFCSFFLEMRAARDREAEAHFRECLNRASTLPRSSWLRAIPWWARVERERARRDFRAALHSGRAMAALARAGQHESMGRLADRAVLTLVEGALH